MADDSKFDSQGEPLVGTRQEARNHMRAVDVDANHRLRVASQADPAQQAAVVDSINKIRGATGPTQKDLYEVFGELSLILAKLVANPALAGEAAAAATSVVGAGNKTLSDLNTLLSPLAAAAQGDGRKSITNVSGAIAGDNAVRRNITVTNLSTSAVLYVCCAAAAVAGAGIPLAPAADATHPGGSCTIAEYAGAVTGIMSAADATANNVAVLEV